MSRSYTSSPPLRLHRRVVGLLFFTATDITAVMSVRLAADVVRMVGVRDTELRSET
jgi:hypothetical protein